MEVRIHRRASKIAVLAACIVFSSLVFAQENAADKASDAIAKAWTLLNKTTFIPKGIPGVRWDYYSKRIGGFRSLYANLRSLISYREFNALVPVDIFVSGPHTKNELNLDSESAFGHYNIEFVRWLQQNLVPAQHNEQLRKTTQPFYDSYFRDLTRTYYATHNSLHNSKLYFNTEKQWLIKNIENGSLGGAYYQRYEYLLDWQQDTRHSPKIGRGGYRLVYEFDPNQVGPASAFWLRRAIDGTDSEFFELLKIILNTYDPYFMKLNSWKENVEHLYASRPMLVCQKRAKLLELVRSIKSGNKNIFNDVAASRECILIHRGSPYLKIHNINKLYTLVEVKADKTTKLMWSLFLK